MGNSGSSSDHPARRSDSPVSSLEEEHSKGSVSPQSRSDNRDRAGTKSSSSLKSPRTARFAEATSVNSPLNRDQSPFADPPKSQPEQSGQSDPAATVSELGFGYVADNQPERHSTFPQTPQAAALNSNPPKSPLKSALKTPGTARTANPLSPTFREEQILEWHEKHTEKENARDLKIKTRVRLAKVLLRGVSFSCSLIILAMAASTFNIFNATKALASRNNLTPWAPNTNPWSQILVLVIACISLAFTTCVLITNCRKGHRRAEKVAVYYTVFSVMFVIGGIIMWVVATAALQNSKQTGNGKDLWGWACADNARSQLFQAEVNYSLICRMQDWSLVCCIIEVIVELMVIGIYAVVFYRFWSRRKLRKSMENRDKARSDLYLATLRSQSALNTPMFPRTPGFPPTPGFPQTPGASYYPEKAFDPHSAAEEGNNFPTQYATAQPGTSNAAAGHPFQLQPPPIRIQEATPTMSQGSFSPQTPTRINQHVDAAPGEKTYDAVPIPAAYTSPMSSPTFMPQAQSNQIVPGMAITTDQHVESQKFSGKK